MTLGGDPEKPIKVDNVSELDEARQIAFIFTKAVKATPPAMSAAETAANLRFVSILSLVKEIRLKPQPRLILD